jgi:hypothetical protein
VFCVIFFVELTITFFLRNSIFLGGGDWNFHSCRSRLVGFAKDKEVLGATEYDKSKEKAGYTAGKHISKKSDWWFNRSKKDWTFGGSNGSSSGGADGEGTSGTGDSS